MIVIGLIYLMIGAITAALVVVAIGDRLPITADDLVEGTPVVIVKVIRRAPMGVLYVLTALSLIMCWPMMWQAFYQGYRDNRRRQ